MANYTRIFLLDETALQTHVVVTNWLRQPPYVPAPYPPRRRIAWRGVFRELAAIISGRPLLAPEASARSKTGPAGSPPEMTWPVRSSP